VAKGTSFEKKLVDDLERIKIYYNQITNLTAALDRKLGVETNQVALGLKSGVASNSQKLTYIVTRINDLKEDNQVTAKQFRQLLNGIIQRAEC
jgi:hypothetical protein